MPRVWLWGLCPLLVSHGPPTACAKALPLQLLLVACLSRLSSGMETGLVTVMLFMTMWMPASCRMTLPGIGLGGALLLVQLPSQPGFTWVMPLWAPLRGCLLLQTAPTDDSINLQLGYNLGFVSRSWCSAAFLYEVLSCQPFLIQWAILPLPSSNQLLAISHGGYFLPMR